VTQQPEVREGQWIVVGDPSSDYTVDGLVMGVYADYISVGYYQNRIKAIKEDVVWKDGCWRFKYSGPNGSYLQGPEEWAVKQGPPRERP
jgi:hypothetical protein